jgi:hypothetical protein
MPQQGQLVPFQSIKISHEEQRFWPELYLASPTFFIALYLEHIP